jgi:hypothetical protein
VFHTEYGVATGTCVCVKGYFLSQDGQSCIICDTSCAECATNGTDATQNTDCTQCATGMEKNTTTNTCECKKGVWDGTGAAVGACVKNAALFCPVG